jgi:hypothetical protein
VSGGRSLRPTDSLGPWADLDWAAENSYLCAC